MKYISSAFAIESLLRAFVSISLIGSLWINFYLNKISFYEIASLIALVGSIIYIIQLKSVQLEWLQKKKIIYFLAFGMTVFYLFWAIKYNSIQTGDFGVYWKCGAEFLTPIDKWLENCRGSYMKNPLIYAQRAFFFNVPFSWVVQHNYLLWKLVMAILHITSVFLLYKVIKGMAGNISGLVAALLLFINPEWTYLITTSSADNIIVLVQLLLFYIFFKFTNKLGNIDYVKFFPLFILIFFISEWLRSISIFILITFLLFPSNIKSEKVYLYRALLLVLAYILAAFLTSFIMRNLWGSSYISPLNFISSLAEIDLLILPPQNPQVSIEWIDHLWLSIEPIKRNLVGFHRFYDEILTQYIHFPRYYFEKVSILFSGTGNMDLLKNIIPANIDNVFTSPNTNIPTGIITHKLALYANILILLIVLYTTLFLEFSFYQLISLTFLSIYMGMMGGFGPSLPRYGVLMALPLAILGSALGHKRLSDRSFFSTTFFKVIPSIVFVITIYLTGALLSKAYTYYFPRIALNVFQPEAKNMSDGEPCNQIRVPIHSYFDRRMRSEFQANIQCASYSFPLKNNTQSLSFFITREKLPFPNEDIGKANFEYKIKLGENITNWNSLNYSSSKWFEFNIAQHDVKSLEIYIRRIDSGSKFEFEIRDLLYR